jgi:hypothetical protein
MKELNDARLYSYAVYRCIRNVEVVDEENLLLRQ